MSMLKIASRIVHALSVLLVAYMLSPLFAFAAPSDDFVITVQSDLPGTSSNTQFTIPTNPYYTYNYNVDCDNDGSFEVTGQTGDYTCSFATAGQHTIRIGDNTGTRDGFPQIYFNNVGDKEKITGINQWGTGRWQDFGSSFWGCINLNDAGEQRPMRLILVV
jgi:hypothetical protein